MRGSQGKRKGRHGEHLGERIGGRWMTKVERG